MSWQTRLTAGDYVVEQMTFDRIGRLRFVDTRNRRGYMLSEEAQGRLTAKYGPKHTAPGWVELAVREAMIPHPYEEYV